MINAIKSIVRRLSPDATKHAKPDATDDLSQSSPAPIVLLPDTLVRHSHEAACNARALATQSAGHGESYNPPTAFLPSMLVPPAPHVQTLRWYGPTACEDTIANGIALLHLPSLSALPDVVPDNTTVVFDIDQTLVVRKRRDPQRRFILTQPDTATVVQRLQTRDDLCVIGLTARPLYWKGHNNARGTETELRRLGIDLGWGMTDIAPMAGRRHDAVGFRSGIAYTGSEISKGQMLRRLRNHVPMQKLLLVDDRADNLHTVAQFALAANIPYLAMHYVAALSPQDLLHQQNAWHTLCDAWCARGANLVFVGPG